jgi:putative NADH-flavin reductase
MKIALIGATGTIGQRILREALGRGHTVTAIARDPSRVAEQNPNLTVVAGDLLDPRSVADAVAGHDAVVSSYGPPQGSEQTLVDATRSLIDGVKRAGVKRLVAVGGAGSLEVSPGVQLVDTPHLPEAWRPIALAHRDALDVLRNQGGDLEWTNFSPAAFIAPGERTGTFRLGGDGLVTDAEGQSRISAEDYAIALLDEVEKPRHVGRRFTVGY